MSGTYQCNYIAGRCDHPECGPYGREVGPEPTAEDYCGQGGHGYYGDDLGAGRCYCGQATYPAGGPKEEGAS